MRSCERRTVLSYASDVTTPSAAIEERYREILGAFGDDPAEREALSNALHTVSVTRKTLTDQKV